MIAGKNYKQFMYGSEKYVDLTLYQFGWEACEPLHSFGPFIRNNYLFHFVCKGKGTLHVYDEDSELRSFPMKAGEGFLIFPDYTTVYSADTEDPWEYIWVELNGVRVQDTIERSGLKVFDPVFRPTVGEGRIKIQEDMSQLVRNGDESSLYLTSLAYKILDSLLKYSDKKVRSDNISQITFQMNEAISFIEHYYNQNITVNDIANHVKLSRSYFSKSFHAHTGQSPQNFLFFYRMKKASQLLNNTDYPIKEIAQAVGYQNQFHFSKAFRKYYNTSPSEWRKQFE